MHEIVTVQLGEQANYVGTHFWNAQESYFTYGNEEESPVDHNIHFRPGIGADGSETFTPRAVVYDLKGAFGTLRRENALYELQGDAHLEQGPWSGSTNIIREFPIAPSTYQQHLDQGLDPPPLTTASVRFWSDYNRVFYHPRSIVQLHEYELNSTLMPFERWNTGEELFSNLDREHDLLDRDLRLFLEECDQLQGLQLIAGADDAWGGFTARYLERIRDELGKTSAWVWGLENGGRKTREKMMLQTANIAQSLYHISPQASMYIPLTTVPSHVPAYVSFDAASKWHTSALQAMALETITLPSRLRSGQIGRTSLSDVEATLGDDGNRKLARVDFGVEDPSVLAVSANGSAPHDSRVNGYSNGYEADGTSSLPHPEIAMQPRDVNLDGRRVPVRRNHVFSTLESLRGTWKSSLEIEDTNLAARNRFAHGPRTESHQSQLLFPLLDSFPQILNFGSKPDKVAVQATLATASSVADRVRSVERAARLLIGIDEREALCDGLLAICEEYAEGWDSDDESEGDA